MPSGYRPINLRKTLAIIGLIACIGASIGAAMAAGWAHALASELAAYNRNPNGPISNRLLALGGCQAVVWLASVGSFIFTIVVFLMWHYRAAANARALGAELRIAPGWAVGWWFVPVASLVMPVRSIYEISKASSVPDDDLADLGHPGTGAGALLIGLWWALWLIGNTVGWVSATSAGNAMTTSAVQRSAIIGLVGEVVHIGAASLAIAIVLSISKRQGAHALALLSAPPPAEEGPTF